MSDPTSSSSQTFKQQLIADGLIGTPSATLSPLVGGVSSEIYLVTEGSSSFVVKRALAKLKVKDDWFADTSRNTTECDYIEYVSQFTPRNVPEIIARGDGYFAMEHLGEGYENWKRLMLDGHFREHHGMMAGAFLSQIHLRTRGDQTAAKLFDRSKNFYDLRIEPYIITTGNRHPKLRDHFKAEADRLASFRLCLIHGDFSPKNILIRENRMVVLDCEVAYFGDPTFDYAFMLSHLLLKALFVSKQRPNALRSVEAFRQSYHEGIALDPAERKLFSFHAGRLLAMLLLARIDGKSPVEYLQDEKSKSFVREFGYAHLQHENPTAKKLVDAWFNALLS